MDTRHTRGIQTRKQEATHTYEIKETYYKQTEKENPEDDYNSVLQRNLDGGIIENGKFPRFDYGGSPTGRCKSSRRSESRVRLTLRTHV